MNMKRQSPIVSVLRVMRPHQWAKNALVGLPVVLAPSFPSVGYFESAAMAVISFSLCASAGYVLNDLKDIEADRAHATKCRRPFASGDLSVSFGVPLIVALVLASFGIALTTLPLTFSWMLVLYFVGTLSYSFYFKSKLMLDVVVLAGLYTHRILSGGLAVGIPISAWLLAFSMFLFLSLAFAKRYIELRHKLSKNSDTNVENRGYAPGDLSMVSSMGPVSGFIAVLVFSLYVESNTVVHTYNEPQYLWLICPVLLYWIGRVWFLAHRGLIQDDPVKFALLDGTSWICMFIVGLVAVVSRIGPKLFFF
jgi:4-hydroxybenzoate polyprenyltransferase